MLYTVRIPASQWEVGLDILSRTSWRSDSTARTLMGIGFTGSLVAGDAEIELFMDNSRAGVMYNTTAGNQPPTALTDMFRANRAIPGGAIIVANLAQFGDNAAADAGIFLTMDLR